MNEKEKKELMQIVRILFIIIALGLLIFAVYCLTGAYRTYVIISDMKKPLVSAPIDLSVAETYKYMLPEVKNYFHGIGLWIELNTDEKDESEIEQLVEDITGTVTLTDLQSELKHQFNIEEFGFGSFTNTGSKDTAELFFYEQFPEYESRSSELVITIDTPAEQLAGIRQTLIAQYNLCGLESLAMLLSIGLGVVALIIGICIGCINIRSFRKQLKEDKHNE